MPIDVTLQNNFEFISQPSLPGVLQSDKPRGGEVYEDLFEPYIDKFQHLIQNSHKIERKPKKEKQAQKRETRAKRHLSGQPDGIGGTTRPLDELPDSKRNTAGKTVHQRSITVTRSSSSVRGEKLTNNCPKQEVGSAIISGTANTHEQLEKRSAAKPIVEKGLIEINSGSSDVKMEKSTCNGGHHYECFNSDSSRNFSLKEDCTDCSMENTIISRTELPLVIGDNETTPCPVILTSEIQCSILSADISLERLKLVLPPASEGWGR